MLRRLQIRDFVIRTVSNPRVRWRFGALTGETGAGKSILLTPWVSPWAPEGEPGVVRPAANAPRSSPNSIFPTRVAWRTGSPPGNPTEDDCVLLRRVVDAGGRSRAWLNGTAVTLGQMREAADWLADIHGQHAHHALLRGDAQRTLLDAHGGLEALADRLRRAGASGRQRAAPALPRQRMPKVWRASARCWRGNCNELRETGYAADEWAELNHEQARLAHAASPHRGRAERGRHAARFGHGHRPGARPPGGTHRPMAGFDDALAPVAELLGSAAIQVDEAGHALRRYRERLEIDPGGSMNWIGGSAQSPISRASIDSSRRNCRRCSPTPSTVWPKWMR